MFRKVSEASLPSEVSVQTSTKPSFEEAVLLIVVNFQDVSAKFKPSITTFREPRLFPRRGPSRSLSGWKGEKDFTLETRHFDL